MKLFSYIALFTYSLIPLSLFAENKQGKIDSLQSCLKIAQDDSTRATILREIGLVYVNNGNYPKGIECFLKSKDIFQSIKNEEGVFRCDNILGVSYCFMRDFKTSLVYLLNAKRGFEDGLIYDNLGLVYYNKKDFSQSLFYFKNALEFYREKSDTNLIANKLNDVGSIYELLGKMDTAIYYYSECLKMSKGNDMNTANVLASLGDIYFRQGLYHKSLHYENKSLALAKKINDLISIRETEKMLSDIYFKMGDYKTSLFYYKNYVAIKDTLVNDANIKQLIRVEEKSKFEKEKELVKAEQNKKDAIQNEILKRRQTLILAISSGLGLILIFSFFLFINYRKIRKSKDIISEQKQLLEHKNKEVADSINYAKNIQQAILPSHEYMQSIFPEHFIIYKPKDILSGDFYWSYMDEEYKYMAVADSTGHGIPASLLTMIGTSLLNEIVIERKIKSPELILNALREEIIKSLNKQGASEERKDGMDISIFKIPLIGKKLECACANNPIYIIRGKELIEIKSDRFPVGKYVKDSAFTLHEMYLQNGDIVYGFSDGFSDQFGEATGKKLMSKRFKEWLIELSPYKDMGQIKNELENRFNLWKGNNEQIDDVTIMAIRF